MGYWTHRCTNLADYLATVTLNFFFLIGLHFQLWANTLINLKKDLTSSSRLWVSITCNKDNPESGASWFNGYGIGLRHKGSGFQVPTAKSFFFSANFQKRIGRSRETKCSGKSYNGRILSFFQYLDQVKLFAKASCHLKDNRLPLPSINRSDVRLNGNCLVGI